MGSKLKKPTLFMFVGMPGSGTTFLSTRMAVKLKIVHVSSERIRNELFEKPNYSQEEEGVVKHIMLMMTEQFLLAGLSVVYDQSLNREADRREMREIARKFKAKPVLIWQQVDPTTCFTRVSARNPLKNPDDKYAAPISKELFVSLCRQIQLPKTEQAIVISGKHSFNGQFQSIVRNLHEANMLSDNKLIKKIPSPGLVNLVTNQHGRVDHGRRNISVE